IVRPPPAVIGIGSAVVAAVIAVGGIGAAIMTDAATGTPCPYPAAPISDVAYIAAHGVADRGRRRDRHRSCAARRERPGSGQAGSQRSSQKSFTHARLLEKVVPSAK